MTIGTILFYTAAGLAAGFFSGLGGVGGALTVVPVLNYALPIEGVTKEHVAHMAVGTSFFTTVTISMCSIFWRHQAGDLDWKLLKRSAWWVIPSAFVVTLFGTFFVSAVWLRLAFVLIVSYMIFAEIRSLIAQSAQAKSELPFEHSSSPSPIISLARPGIFAGIVGGFLGGGAAFAIVPFLTRHHYDHKVAATVASGLSIIIGLFAGAVYVANAPGNAELLPHSWGYLYLPAFLGISVTALLGSKVGVWFSHKPVVTRERFRKAFVVYMCLSLSVMIYRLLTE